MLFQLLLCLSFFTPLSLIIFLSASCSIGITSVRYYWATRTPITSAHHTGRGGELAEKDKGQVPFPAGCPAYWSKSLAQHPRSYSTVPVRNNEKGNQNISDCPLSFYLRDYPLVFAGFPLRCPHLEISPEAFACGSPFA